MHIYIKKPVTIIISFIFIINSCYPQYLFAQKAISFRCDNLATPGISETREDLDSSVSNIYYRVDNVKIDNTTYRIVGVPHYFGYPAAAVEKAIDDYDIVIFEGVGSNTNSFFSDLLFHAFSFVSKIIKLITGRTVDQQAHMRMLMKKGVKIFNIDVSITHLDKVLFITMMPEILLLGLCILSIQLMKWNVIENIFGISWKGIYLILPIASLVWYTILTVNRLLLGSSDSIVDFRNLIWAEKMLHIPSINNSNNLKIVYVGGMEHNSGLVKYLKSPDRRKNGWKRWIEKGSKLIGPYYNLIETMNIYRLEHDEDNKLSLVSVGSIANQTYPRELLNKLIGDNIASQSLQTAQ